MSLKDPGRVPWRQQGTRQLILSGVSEPQQQFGTDLSPDKFSCLRSRNRKVIPGEQVSNASWTRKHSAWALKVRVNSDSRKV